MYRYKRKRRGATLISRVLAVARKMSPISRAFAETKGKMGGGRRGWKRRQKFPSRSSWRNMSETKAATESQLAKQRARNAMPEKARGRWGRRERVGEKEKERMVDSWWFPWWITPPVSSTFFPFQHPFLSPPLFFAFSRAQTRGGGGGGPRSRASVYLPWPNAIVCSPTRHTLVPPVFFQWPPWMGFPLTLEDRVDASSSSNNVYINRTKFSNA